LKSDITRLEGEMETLQARASRLQHAIDLRRIRSPVAGRVAEMSQLPVGTVVPRGFRLADVVPEGRLRVVAFFSPPVALGRLRVGQVARMRLDGFPWVQYGTLKARVERLASELRDGRVRVELSLQPDPDSPIPLQHGLPGVVEVEVERTSPATLALRAAGRIIRRTAYSGAESDSFRDGKAGS
jgi:membrane fusion protein (multidrug efflux system)